MELPLHRISPRNAVVLADLIEPFDLIVAFILRHCFYIDDGMYGADAINELIRIRKAVQNLLASAGFILHKYRSNSSEILQSIQPELIETKLTKSIGGDKRFLFLAYLGCQRSTIFNQELNLTTVTLL